MSEFSSLENHVRKPEPTDERYVVKQEIELGPSREIFNGMQGRKLRRVEIYAVRINHVQGNSPLQAYVGAEDIKQIRIAAHSIELRSPLIFHQTDVELIAGKLTASSTIGTGPDPKGMLPAGPGEAALAGSNAGNVTLICGEFGENSHINIRANGGPGQSLTRNRKRSDKVPVLDCPFNATDRQKAIGALFRFPEGDSVTSLEALMTPPMGSAQGRFSWPSLKEYSDVASLAGKVAYVRAEFAPQLRNMFNDAPDQNYWEAGTPHGPWEDDWSGYGTPARGGDGGSLRTNSQAILKAVDYNAAPGMHSFPVAEPDQDPEPVIHLLFKLQLYPEYRGKFPQGIPKEAIDAIFGAMSATVEVKRKTPPPAPDCEDAGKPGEKTLLPAGALTTTPEVLDLAVLYAKDLYLAGYHAEARDMLKSLSFEGLHDTRSQSLAIETQVLLDRLDKNLDFYGNPVNWVPLLSVDTSLAIFNGEIDRSLNLLYLAHVLDARWNQYEEQVKILEAAQKHAEGLAQETKNRIKDAWKEIGLLQGKMEDVKAESESFKKKLEALQKELLEKAETEVKRKEVWEKVESVFKILSTAAAAIPVGAPYTTMVSKTFDAVSSIAEVNATKDSLKWNDYLVTGFDKLTQDVLKTGLDDEALAGKLRERITSNREVDKAKAEILEIGEKLSNLKSKDISDKEKLEKQLEEHQRTVDAAEEKFTKGVEKFNASTKGLATLFKTTNTEVRKLMVSADERDKRVAEELKKLEENSERFKELNKALDSLTVKRTEVAMRLLDLETELGKLAAALTNNMLNLDTLFREKGRKIGLLNPRISQLVKRLRQQAGEDLNKYQYYLKKSYEYNFLEPAEYDFGAPELQAQITRFLQGGSDSRELSADQFRILKTVYETTLGKLGSKIVGSLQHSYGRSTARMALNLDPEALSSLNRSGAFSLNLDDKLPQKSEDIRIRNISISEIGLNRNARRGNLQVRIWHSGTSCLQRDRNRYQFISTSPRMWGVSVDPDTGKTTPIEPADKVDAQMIRQLFGVNEAGSTGNSGQLGRYNPAFSGPLYIEVLAGDALSAGLVSRLRLDIEYECRMLK